MWKDANAIGAIVGAWGGMILALTTWICYTAAADGEITVDNLGKLEPNLAGNLMAICSSGIIHVIFSLIKPQNYDFVSMGQIAMLDDDQRGLDAKDYDPAFLQEAKAWVQKWGYGFTIVMVVIWPILSIPAGVFTRGYWSFWVFISIAWSFIATFVIIFLPLYESKDAIMGVLLAMVGKRERGAPKATPAETPAVAEPAPVPEPEKVDGTDI
jgi:hypothetical protein